LADDASGRGKIGPKALALQAVHRLWAVPFLRYLLVGGLNTAFGYGVFALFILLGVHYAIAALLGTVLGILFNFKTTGSLVFKSHDNALIVKFFAVYGVNYVIGVLILKAFKALGVHVLVTAALTTLPMAALAFLLMRKFVFGAPLSGAQGRLPP
jgi:putative flippase GtrA